MDLTPYVAALRDDLAAAAAVGDEATTRAGTSLAAALEPAVRLALMDALSDLAGEVSAALEDRTVSLRLSGRQVEVVVDRGASGEGADGPAGAASSPFAGPPGGDGPHRHAPPPPPGFGGGGDGPGFGGFGGRGGPDVGDISRMTLRLVDQIKGQAERAAASQGMSLNSWIAQAVQGALQDKHRRGGWGGWDVGGRDGGGWGGWDAGWGSGASGSGGDGPSGSDTPGSGTPGSGTPGTGTPGSGSDSPGTGSSGTSGPSTGPGPERPDEGGPDGGAGGGVDGWVRG